MNRTVLAAGLIVVMPLVGLLVASLGRQPNAIVSPLLQKPAPRFTLSPVGGGAPVSLDTLKGKPAVINFWSTWCAPCMQEHPLLVASARQVGGRVAFVGVMYQDEEAKILSFLSQRGSSYPTLADPEGKTAIAFGVSGVPETFFIDPKGTVVAKHEGALDRATLETLLAKAGGSLR